MSRNAFQSSGLRMVARWLRIAGTPFAPAVSSSACSTDHKAQTKQSEKGKMKTLKILMSVALTSSLAAVASPFGPPPPPPRIPPAAMAASLHTQQQQAQMRALQNSLKRSDDLLKRQQLQQKLDATLR